MTSNRLAILALAGLLALTAYALYADAVYESQISRFMQQGPRFTAQDGQALCERVKALEERVKALKERPQGYRDAGKTPMSCDYNLPSELR